MLKELDHRQGAQKKCANGQVGAKTEVRKTQLGNHGSTSSSGGSKLICVGFLLSRGFGCSSVIVE